MSIGRPTYGRLGRSDVNAASDDAVWKPAFVNGLENAKIEDICAGIAVSAALAQEKTYVWGYGTMQQLGKPADDDSDELMPIELAKSKPMQGKNIVQIAFGGQHAALIASAEAVPSTPAPTSVFGQVHAREEDRDADGGSKKKRVRT
eukprot:scaffold630_cov399-Prasinococcus_capsulatus_cf.AAC.17